MKSLISFVLMFSCASAWADFEGAQSSTSTETSSPSSGVRDRNTLRSYFSIQGSRGNMASSDRPSGATPVSVGGQVTLTNWWRDQGVQVQYWGWALEKSDQEPTTRVDQASARFLQRGWLARQWRLTGLLGATQRWDSWNERANTKTTLLEVGAQGGYLLNRDMDVEMEMSFGSNGSTAQTAALQSQFVGKLDRDFSWTLGARMALFEDREQNVNRRGQIEATSSLRWHY